MSGFKVSLHAMKKTLFLHIGHFKTGTTALQVFLSNNQAFLARNDLFYAETRRHLSKHSDFAFSLLHATGVKTLMHGYDKPEEPEDLWQTLFDEVRRSRQSRSSAPTPGEVVAVLMPAMVPIPRNGRHDL